MTDPPHVDGTAAVSLRGIRKHYGAVHAADGIDLDVSYGELFGLIGHNGIGKGMLLKMMLGLAPVTANSIRVAGASVCEATFRTVCRQIGYLPENLVLHDNLSRLETLWPFVKLKGVPAADYALLLARIGLAGAVDQPVRACSEGMRQRLGLVQALLDVPRVLFLGEPANGLDLAAIRDSYATLQALREQDVTILITSHILAEPQQRIDRFVILADGHVLAPGSVAALHVQADLPLASALRVKAGAHGVLQAQLAPLCIHGAETVDGQAEHEVTLRRSRSLKMDTLQVLQPLSGRLLDLQIHELSFEDVFLGLGQTKTA